jgi:threonine/homoserine efflux transporter RhtA
MNPRHLRRRIGALAALWAGASLLAGPAAAQSNFPITPQQRSTAQQVAQAGVPLSELAMRPIHTPCKAATRCGTSPSCS